MKLSKLSVLVAGLAVTAVSACTPSPTRPGVSREELEDRYLSQFRPATHEEFKKLAHELTYSKPHEVRIIRPSQVLPRLHTWLVEGSGLTRQRVRSGMELLLLEPVPARVQAELEAATFGDHHDSGVGVLQAYFWRRVAQLQREGFTLGFFTQASSNQSGVYFDDLKLVGLDVAASSTTLAHELQHHEQYVVIERFRGQAPRALSRRCIEKASPFFADVDATTLQLPKWRQAIHDLPIVPPTQPDLLDMGEGRLPTLLPTLLAHLDYPFEAGEIFGSSAQECATLVDTVHALTEAFQDFGPLSEKLDALDDSHVSGARLRQAQVECVLGRAAISQASQASCGLIDAELQELETRVGGQKEEIARALSDLADQRRKESADLLSGLSPDVQYDLCRFTPGFMSLMQMPPSCER